MTTISIPASLEGVTDRLGNLGDLIRLKEWEKAALIAAFVRLSSRGGDRRSKVTTDFETPDQFAARGIVGLRSKNTVALYVERWLDTHDGVYPEPGAKVELPDLDWPPTSFDDERTAAVADRDRIIAQAEIDGTGAAKALDIAKNTKAMAAAIKGSPAVAAAARSAIAEAVDIVVPGGPTIPEMVEAQTRASGYDMRDWEETREGKLRRACSQGCQALREAQNLEAQGDLSKDELYLVQKLRDAATAFVTVGMEVRV